VSDGTLQIVLAHLRPGSVIRLELTREQKRSLRDRDGQIALDVLRHLLAAREAAEAPEPFPFVEDAIQRIARRLGYTVGIKRCRRMRRRLIANGVIADNGSYRQPYRNAAGSVAWRVRLYRLAVTVGGLALAKSKRAIGRPGRVKGRSRPRLERRWWEHPLFGDISGRPPPGLRLDLAKRMRSLDEKPAEAARVAAVTAP
jgi:hypothetical protein